MVDRLISVSQYSNCKDNIDNFLLNLTSSVDTSTTIKSHLQPTHIDIGSSVNAVMHQYNQEENIQEENIIAYCIHM